MLDANPAEDRVQVVRDVAGRVDVRRRWPDSSSSTRTPFSCATGDAKVGTSGSIPMPTTAKSHGDAIAVGGHGRLHAFGPLEGGDLVSAQQLDAVRAVERADHRADLLAQNPFEGHALGKDRGHPNPELRQGGRHLAADEPHAHHHRVPIRHGLALDRVALGHRAQLVDPGQLGPGNVEPPVPSAGGDQDLLVLELLARVEDHRVRGGIDRDDARLRAARHRAPHTSPAGLTYQPSRSSSDRR